MFTLSAEIQPGARHVQTLRQTLADAGPSCVFREPQFPAERVHALSAGLAVQVAELDPLGVDVAVDATGYEQLLTRLGDSLGDCLEHL